MNRIGRSRLSRSSRLFLVSLLLLLIGTVLAEKDSTDRVSDSHDIFGIQDQGNTLEAGRTFGQKRIQFMLMPMVYKMGVMMTMLTVLTVISLKGLVIGVILLVLKLSAIFGKLYASFHNHGGSAGWTPPQPVHVHLHNSGGYAPHGHTYHGWESGPPDESYYYKG